MIGFSMKYCCTFLLLLFLSIFGGFAQDKVECWGRYEISLLAKVTGNPFDVEFTATFSGPYTTLTVRGFYDGNDTFRIRFMPMIQGTWSYVTKSEISGLNEMRGRLECVLRVKGIMVLLRWMELIILNMLMAHVTTRLERLLIIGCMWSVISPIKL